MSVRTAPGSTRVTRTSTPILRVYYAILIALLYLPIAILVLFSFNANQVLAFPLQGKSLKWEGEDLIGIERKEDQDRDRQVEQGDEYRVVAA